MPRLREIGEVEALRRLIGARATASSADQTGVIVGTGDDAAVLRTGVDRDLVATTDAFVEGRHYRTEWLAPREIGARLAAANLSDLAAMAARPRWALLSIGARGDDEIDEWVEIQRGLGDALATEGAAIVGGNLTAIEGGRWMSVTLFGEVATGGAWRRGGARAGDLLVVTGCPGRAGAGQRVAERLGDAARGEEWRPLLDAWLRPTPRIRFALELARSSAVRAAIDISDGLAGDLARLCAASAVSAEIDEAGWPDDPWVSRAAETLSRSTDELRYGPSDDYELIIALDPSRRADGEAIAGKQGVPFTVIGRFTSGEGQVVIDARGARRALTSSGYDPFESSR